MYSLVWRLAYLTVMDFAKETIMGSLPRLDFSQSPDDPVFMTYLSPFSRLSIQSTNSSVKQCSGSPLELGSGNKPQSKS
jgi:hypothetical protein